MINIRNSNEIIQIDAYFMSTQTKITSIVIDCIHIFIVNAQGYFYQWTVKKKDRYKQTIIIHKRQEKFNVTMMNFKNSSIYVQKQTNFMLKNFRQFVKIYIDDIIIFYTFLKNHIKHLNLIFQKLIEYNVILNSKKSFIDYSSIVLLRQLVNVFDMFTIEKKFAIIAKFVFFKIFKELKTYIDLTK